MAKKKHSDTEILKECEACFRLGRRVPLSVRRRRSLPSPGLRPTHPSASALCQPLFFFSRPARFSPESPFK